MSDAFFQIHRDLDREGPGQPEDVHWTLDLIAPPARVLDAASGPGADTVTFAETLPDAEILAVDWQEHFAAATTERTAEFGARVSARAGDMFEAEGPFDLIWCAGAAYFAGVTETLTRFKPMLAKGGHVAFSEPVRPGKDAPKEAFAFWQEYADLTDVAGTQARILEAGYSPIANRLIIGAPWHAYYAPMQARMETLREGASEELTAALDEAQREIDLWRAASDHIAYMLYLAQPDA